MTAPTPRRRQADARNRAVRTALQQLAIDVAAAVVLLLLPVVTAADGWGDFQWALLGFSLVKTVVATALAYAMRVWLDPARRIPTLLPPEDTEPTVPAPDVVAQVGPAGGLVAGQGATIPDGAPVEVLALD